MKYTIEILISNIQNLSMHKGADTCMYNILLTSACCVILHAIVVIWLLIKLTFQEYTLSESNGLDPDHDQLNLGPDLGPNGLQRLSEDNKSRH